uniref:16S rRNA-processing protein n=1 Tax=Paulinella longichromatophora TaxID=1708747 RepID=A0A2H4ZPL5_9EUKA|nr:16S rRNA-processing protein [Paulinella longichromatophora]
MDKEKNDWLIVGNIVAPQGLKGEMRVNPCSDFPERFTLPGQRWLQNPKMEITPIFLESGRQLPGKSIYVIRLRGIANRGMVESLIGSDLLVLSSDRPQLAEGEFHLLDLVGLEVRLEASNQLIGYVEDLISGGNDLLVVELIPEFSSSKRNRRILIPLVKSIVFKIKLEEKWLSITPPPGLLEI